MRWPWTKKTDERVVNEALDINDERLWSAINDISSVSASGEPVNETTAMKYSAVYACVSLLSRMLASIPCSVYQNENGYDEPVAESRLNKILSAEPSQLMTAFVFWEAIGLDHWTSGNGYSIISRTGVGDPKALIWCPSQAITPRYNQSKTRILYDISINGRTATYDQDDILHFPCIGWDGLGGMSPVKAATESIGLGLSGEKFNSHYFTNSVTSDIAITYEKPMLPDAQKELEKYLAERYANKDNLRKPFIGTNGAKVTPLNISAVDAQMLDARDYQVEDICRFYGIPPWMVGAMKKNTSFGSGLSEQTLGFVKFTFRPYVKRFEQEINRKLVRHPKRFCKFNLDAILRADIKTRNEAYKIALGGNQMPGYMSINEVRRIEGLPPKNEEKYNDIYQPPTTENTPNEEEV